METSETLKQIVRDKYGEIAKSADQESCCDCGCSSDNEFSKINDDYTQLQGYNPDADLQLGCGVPTEYAEISAGDTVLDLGSGAGNDVFVARSIVGDSGHVIGVDMTEEMIVKANNNRKKLGFENIEFRFGDIEELPVRDSEVDVTISNCVLNLVPDKAKAFREIFRTLRPGGHFCISDVVLNGDLPPALKKSAEMYAGCVAGALQESEYIDIIRNTGFTNIEVRQRRKTPLTDEILTRYLDADALQAYHNNETGIFSITVYGVKPE